MGDWTSGQLTIHSCPPHQVRAVTTVLEYYALATEDTPEVRKAVEVGDPYRSDSFPVGDADRLARRLVAEAPDVSFTVYEEPAYEWIGTICSYVPGLGLFTADCDTAGNPMFPQDMVLALDDEPAEVRQEKLGVPWLTAIKAMPPATPVVEPDSYATQWNRRSGEVIVVDGKVCGAELLFATHLCGDTEVSPADTVTGSDPEMVAVDAALAERGFIRATPWVPLDETSLIWRADVYRHPAH